MDSPTTSEETSAQTTLNEQQRRVQQSKLYFSVSHCTWPIVYHSSYNIGFWGLEQMHPFDSGKWGRIFRYLKDAGMVSESSVVEPAEASNSDLLVVHTKRYLDCLRWSAVVATIMEVPCIACVPNCLVQRKALRPFRLHTGGSILAAKLALERGWAINIGGGFHHCSADRAGISRKVELRSFTDDSYYLAKLESELKLALNEFTPQLIVYNAGTDVLAGDPLGRLSISPKGIIRRDEIVFSMARTVAIPIVMLTSGGYQRSNARIIANSILNLHSLNFISLPTADSLSSTKN